MLVVLAFLSGLGLNPDMETTLKNYATGKRTYDDLVVGGFLRIQVLLINNFMSLLMYSAAYKKTNY